MTLPRNLGPRARAGYVLTGLALVALAVLVPDLDRPWSWLLGLGGAIVLLEGAAGF